MIGRDEIQQLLAQYSKHGWTLRRVLISERLREHDDAIAGIFGTAEVKPSELDALWFSRSSRPGTTAWELRHLSQTPYALVETVRDESGRDETESVLKRTETKMIEAIGGRRSGH